MSTNGRRGSGSTAIPAAGAPVGMADRSRQPDRLSSLDEGFLALEGPLTPMHTGSISILEGGPLRDRAGRLRLEEIRDLVSERLELVPRFRQRPVAAPLGLGRPLWLDDPSFDVAEHVNAIVVPAPGTPAQLRELTAQLFMRLLDRSRPLWEIWVVDGLADGSIALVEKIHHVMADGVGNVDVALAVCDPSPRHRRPRPVPFTPVPWPGRLARLAGGLLDEIGDPHSLVARIGEAAREPARCASRGAVVARGAISLLGPGLVAPRSPINRPVGRRRGIADASFPLAEVKRIAHGNGATVNDVALTAVAGGFQRLIGAGQSRLDHLQVAVPVSIRLPGDQALGNRVALILVPLPLEETDPLACLALLHASVRARKAAHQPAATAALLEVADRWPTAVVDLIARLVHHQPFANAVVTNVHGPDAPLYILGARVTDVIPLVPLAANLDLSVGILSYAGTLRFGLFADTERVRDLGLLLSGIEGTLRALAARTGVEAAGRTSPRSGAPRSQRAKADRMPV